MEAFIQQVIQYGFTGVVLLTFVGVCVVHGLVKTLVGGR